MGVETATVGFGTPSAEREPNTQARSIGASLLERRDQFLPLTFTRKASTFVPDLDEHAIGAGMNP